MHHRRGSLHARLLCGAAFVGLTFASAASAEEAIKFDIKPQTLTSALNEFGVQSRTAVLFRADVANAKTTQGLVGQVEPEAALTAMLVGTNLTYRREGDAFVIVQQSEGGSGPQDQSGAGGGAAEVEALIVTAQKKEEQIQDVPIAISAFTQKSLDAQKIEGGFDLLKAIPNVTFSKSNFSGYNFSIRGIGTKAVSATTDPGVAVAFNNSTLIVNRLFEQEYFDVERVEVLRGPQMTLYGRNATGGVINVISTRPRLGEVESDFKIETGNYNAFRLRGMINHPLGETMALRIAGAMTKRDGYGINLAASDPTVLNEVQEDVDDRDLWSLRATLGWEPIEQIRVNVLWERFEEDDQRVRTSKQLCNYDPGFDDFDTFQWGQPGQAENILSRGKISQGCQAGSLYDESAFGTPNGASLPYVSGLFYGPLFGALFFPDAYAMGANPYFDFSGVPGPSHLEAPCEAASFFAFMFPLDLCTPDPYGQQRQSTDLRTIHSALEPYYRATADIFELSIDIDLTEDLTFTSQTVYTTDDYNASQDYNRYATVPIFSDSAQAGDFVRDKNDRPILAEGDFSAGALGNYEDGYYNVTPGGVYTDPQLGPSSSLMARDLSQVESSQLNQEFRLTSNYDADWNFSLGANYTHFETVNDYYVFINALSLLSNFFPFNTHPGHFKYCQAGEIPGQDFDSRITPCIYVDPNPLESINGEGHNYFRSANPYELTSAAVFGELYWQATDTIKVTVGGRMSWDQKIFTPLPSQLLLFDYRALVTEGLGPEACTSKELCQVAGTGANAGEGARGFIPLPDIVQEWREPTGRIIVDWKPDLDFTDETMVYGSLAHGYKGGGANPPGIAPPAGIFNAKNSGGVNATTFEPEYVDAVEVGTKNTLMEGALVLNGSAFYYDYEGYQVSKIVDRSAFNENFDTTVWGLELEWIWSPMRNLRFNGTVGHLNTEIAEGERSIDLMDRTQGGNHSSYIDANGVEHELGFDRWMIVKPFVTNSSNCVAPVVLVEHFLLAENGSTQNIDRLCPGGNVAGHTTTSFGVPGYGFYDPTTEAPNGSAGFYDELGGNELPNAPHWTLSFGAQYRFALPAGWDATARVDYYWQDQSFARVHNTEYDRLEAWTNTNVSLWFEQPDWGVTAEVYVKNAFDETPITDAFLNSDDSGLTTNVFTLDPRLVGLSLRKSF